MRFTGENPKGGQRAQLKTGLRGGGDGLEKLIYIGGRRKRRQRVKGEGVFIEHDMA